MFDKDVFVQENWKQLCLIGKEISYKLHCKFKSVDRNDLYEYAMFGMLKALPHMDMSNGAWPKYLYQYGYHNAYISAMRKLGLLRRRLQSRNDLVKSNTARIHTWIDLYHRAIEAESSANDGLLPDIIAESSAKDGLLPDIIMEEKRSFVQNCLGKSLEGQVFECAVRRMSVHIILRKLEISKQILHIILLRIVVIYCLACENLSYQHLLTPPRDFPE